MAAKISGMPAASTLDATEGFEVVQGGQSRRASIAQARAIGWVPFTTVALTPAAAEFPVTGLAGAKEVLVQLWDIQHNDAGSQFFLMQLGVGGSYASAGGSYKHYGSASGSSQFLPLISASVASTIVCGGRIELSHFGVATQKTVATCRLHQNAATTNSGAVVGRRLVAEANDAFKLIMAAGQISAGEMEVFVRG